MNLIQLMLLLSALIFTSGLSLALSRRNALLILAGIEIMFGAAQLNFVIFWRFTPASDELSGLVFVLFILALGVAEAVVGLALMAGVYRHYRTLHTAFIDSQKE